jgi:geranylgeranyl reductase family protein
MREADVLIVGAGPAGSAAAETLARAGCDVVVAEEHHTAGLPVHCTGVLAASAFDELALPAAARLNALSTVRFQAPGGNTFSYTTDAVEAVVIDRVVLDQELLAAATRAGATLVPECRIVRLEVSASGAVAYSSDGRTFSARAVILACGASYRLQQSLGLGLPALYLQSAQLEVPVRSLGAVELHFGVDVAPRGFAWAVPVQRPEGTFARVGLMCQSRADILFARHLDAVSERYQIAERDVQPPRRKLLPLASLDRTYGNRVLAVGDAAGLVKPATGGGIYYAVLTARLAAEHLVAALAADRLDAAALAGYERNWRRHMAREFSLQLTLRRVAQRLSDKDIDALFDVVGSDDFLSVVRRTVRFNEYRRIIPVLFQHAPTRRILIRHLSLAAL